MADVETEIREKSFAIVRINKTMPPSTYTVGLMKSHNLPEMIICGDFHEDTIRDIFYILVDGLQEDPQLFETNSTITGVVRVNDQPGRIGIRKIRKDVQCEKMRVACTYYCDSGFDAYQIVLPDSNGMLPWDDGYDRDFTKVQPLVFDGIS